jgi:hypothetical protein
MLASLEQEIGAALEPVGEKVHVITHLSHVYPDRLEHLHDLRVPARCDSDETMAALDPLQDAASEAIVANGGTISHQHGVGLDHSATCRPRRASSGWTALRSVPEVAGPRRMDEPPESCSRDACSADPIDCVGTPMRSRTWSSLGRTVGPDRRRWRNRRRGDPARRGTSRRTYVAPRAKRLRVGHLQPLVDSSCTAGLRYLAQGQVGLRDRP